MDRAKAGEGRSRGIEGKKWRFCHPAPQMIRNVLDPFPVFSDVNRNVFPGG